MAIKLTPGKPDDLHARFCYRFIKNDDDEFEAKEVPLDEADETCGWIDFWAEDAKACKTQLKRIGGRIYILNERREKRRKDLTPDQAVDELEEYNALINDGLSYRTKAWKLVNSEGVDIEAPLTHENARAIYGDESHNLRNIIQEFLSGTNFHKRAANS